MITLLEAKRIAESQLIELQNSVNDVMAIADELIVKKEYAWIIQKLEGTRHFSSRN